LAGLPPRCSYGGRGDFAELADLVNAVAQHGKPYAPMTIVRLDLGTWGRMKVALVPPNLLSAMWLQLAFHSASGAKLHTCAQCKKPFVVGSGTGRRNTAMYCSRTCNMAAFKARQAEAS
jgi:hypothetical protein